jgi:hypothetical protein
MGHIENPVQLRNAQHGEESLRARSLVLPGGLLGKAGHASCRQVQVRALTGADEEALFERGVSGSARVSAFLARAIAAIEGFDAPIDERLVDQMLLGDRDYLLLRLRQIELGDAVHQVMRCPGCGQKVDVDFAISELPVMRLEAPVPAYRITLAGRPALVRLPTGADQQAVEALALANPAAANTLLFSRVVLKWDGHSPTPDEVRAWSPALRAELAGWLDTHAPGPDLFIDIACPHCKSDMSYVFDLQGFFLPSV